MALTRNLEAREVLNQIVGDPRYADVMRVPLISMPQIILSATALGMFGVATAGAVAGVIPMWAAMICNLIAVYLAFTPLHDASHRAVSSNAFLNDFIGVVVGQLLLPGINMTSFRAIHMDHHRFTGQEGRDPDTAFVTPPKFLGLPYLMFADVHWAIWYARYGRHYWSRKVAVYIALLLVVLVGSHVAFLMSPYWKEFLLLYVVPQRLGLGVVAYTFAHIQHPEGLTWDKEPLQSTMFIGGNSPFRRLLFGQEEHIIHHVVPHVPWFKYKRVWDLANSALRQQGVPERSWFHAPAEIIKPDPDARRPIALVVTATADAGEGIRAVRFEAADGSALPPATAGAHIDLHLPDGITRQYSLVEADAQNYAIAVKLDPASRGGSRAVHDLKVGDKLLANKPRNAFVLYETAPRFVLVAGGIGITPMLPMAHRLLALGKPFELHICARDAASVPFASEWTGTPLAKHVTVHLDDSCPFDAGKVFATHGLDDLLYVCGPQGFMDMIRKTALARGWPAGQIRSESFGAAPQDDADDRPFTVQLAKSGREVPVRQDESIIDALARIGMDVPFACMQGTCGTCLVDVVDGPVDHRDAFLSTEEKAHGDQMCLCVSRARDAKVKIDL